MAIERQDIAQPIARARMSDGPRRGLNVVVAVARQALANDLLDVSAALAFRWLLAIFPFLVAVASVGGFVARSFDIRNPAQRLFDVVGSSLPPGLASVVRDDLGSMIDDAGRSAMTIGVLLALFFAVGGTLGVMRATNRAYGILERRTVWRRYAIAFGLTLLAGAGVIVAFVLLVVVHLFSETLVKAIGGGEAASGSVFVLRWGLAFVALVGASAALYRIAPSVTLRWRTVLPGALLFSVGWLVATAAFAIYVGNVADYGSTFGAVGGAVVLLVWLYITALVLLLGAECNAVLAEVRDPAELDQARRTVRAEHEFRDEETRERTGLGPDEDADDAGAASA